MSIARIEYRNYKCICKIKHKIQSIIKENCNDRMRFYISRPLRLHKQKYNIHPKSRIFIASEVKKL
jgi:hypothetical protein